MGRDEYGQNRNLDFMGPSRESRRNNMSRSPSQKFGYSSRDSRRRRSPSPPPESGWFNPSQQRNRESDFENCPFNPTHVIQKQGFLAHLEKCRENYKSEMIEANREVEMVPCRFNWAHIHLRPEIQCHERMCPDQDKMVPELNFDGNKKCSDSVDSAPKSREMNMKPTRSRSRSPYRPGKFRRGPGPMPTHRHYRQKPQAVNVNNFIADIIGNPNYADEDWDAETKPTPNYDPNEKAKVVVPVPVAPKVIAPAPKHYTQNRRRFKNNSYEYKPREFRKHEQKPSQRFAPPSRNSIEDSDYYDNSYDGYYPDTPDHYGHSTDYDRRRDSDSLSDRSYKRSTPRFERERSGSPLGPCFVYRRDGQDQSETFNSDPESEWDYGHDEYYGPPNLTDKSNSSNSINLKMCDDSDPWKIEKRVCHSPERFPDYNLDEEEEESENTKSKSEDVLSYDWNEVEEPRPTKQIATTQMASTEELASYDWEEIP